MYMVYGISYGIWYMVNKCMYKYGIWQMVIRLYQYGNDMVIYIYVLDNIVWCIYSNTRMQYGIVVINPMYGQF